MPNHQEWCAEAEVERRGSQLVIRSLSITPVDETPTGGLTANVLRDVDLEALQRLLAHDAIHPRAESAIAKKVEDELTQYPRPGRRGRSDLFYALWAQRYVAAWSQSVQPIALLARQHPHSAAQIRDFVAEARERELLSETRRGLPGGALTEKGATLLQD